MRCFQDTFGYRFGRSSPAGLQAIEKFAKCRSIMQRGQLTVGVRGAASIDLRQNRE
jgi:hypothetical protein